MYYYSHPLHTTDGLRNCNDHPLSIFRYKLAVFFIATAPGIEPSTAGRPNEVGYAITIIFWRGLAGVYSYN